MRKILVVLLTLLSVAACKKGTEKDNTTGPIIKPPVSVAVKNSKGQPGQLFVYNTTHIINKDTVHAKIGGTDMVLYKTGDNELTAIIPAVAAGTYNIAFKVGEQPYTASATVDAYVAIKNPDEVATKLVTNINVYLNKFEEINADTMSLKIGMAEMNYLKAYKKAFTEQWAKLTTTEKQEVVYYLREIIPDPALFTTLEANNDSGNRTAATSVSIEEVGFNILKVFVVAIAGAELVGEYGYKVANAVRKLSPAKGTALAIGTGLCVGAGMIYIHEKYKDNVKYQFILEKVNKLISLLNPFDKKALTARTTADQLVFQHKVALNIQLMGDYRSVQASDINSSNATLKSYIGIDATLEKIWTGIKSMTDGLLAILSIDSPLPAYEKCILPTAKISEKAITPGLLSIKNVSDATVKLTATTEGGWQITAESTNGLSGEKEFTFDAVYTFNELNITKTQNAAGKLTTANPILGWYVGSYHLHGTLANGFPNPTAERSVPVYAYFYTADEATAKCIVYIKKSLPRQSGVFDKVTVSLSGSSKHEIYSPGWGKYYGVGKQVSYYLPTAVVTPRESLTSRPEDYAVLFYMWDNRTDYYYYTSWDAKYTGLTAPAALTADELQTINDFILSSSREEVLN